MQIGVKENKAKAVLHFPLHLFAKPVARPMFTGWQSCQRGIMWCKS